MVGNWSPGRLLGRVGLALLLYWAVTAGPSATGLNWPVCASRLILAWLLAAVCPSGGRLPWRWRVRLVAGIILARPMGSEGCQCVGRALLPVGSLSFSPSDVRLTVVVDLRLSCGGPRR